MRTAVALAGILALAGCNSPRVAQPQNEQVVNTARVDFAAPEGAVAPSAPPPATQTVGQPTPQSVVGRYAALLEAGDFDKAYKLLDPGMNMTRKQFEQQFADYRTIHAAVGKIGRTEGAAGSLYSEVQLTLTGGKKDGTPYSVTGPITLRRVNDVPGSTLEQRQWHIYKLELTSNPKTADKLVEQ